MIIKEEVKSVATYTMVQLQKEHDCSKLEYGKGYASNGYVFTDDTGEIVAYAWFNVFESKTISLEKIEVLQKRNGHGTAIIHFLFEEFDIKSMYGTVMQEMGGRPYYFWQSLGAEIDDYYFFTLDRENLTNLKQVKELAS